MFNIVNTQRQSLLQPINYPTPTTTNNNIIPTPTATTIPPTKPLDTKENTPHIVSQQQQHQHNPNQTPGAQSMAHQPHSHHHCHHHRHNKRAGNRQNSVSSRHGSFKLHKVRLISRQGPYCISLPFPLPLRRRHLRPGRSVSRSGHNSSLTN